MKKDKVARAAGPSVLLVEDDAILALALEDALLDAGAGEVVIATRMAEAVSRLDQMCPDALILDVHLADRDDGWALAELVSLLGPRRPRIAFSTGSPDEIPRAVREMGCVFEKPYDPAQLADVLLNQKKTGIIARLKSALREFSVFCFMNPHPRVRPPGCSLRCATGPVRAGSRLAVSGETVSSTK